MEIAWVAKQGLRVKGKQAVLMVNPLDDSSDSEASLFFPSTSHISKGSSVPINGPGEYEIGGIKISGIKNKEQTVYSITVDGIDILIGDVTAVEKLQHKLKEHMIVLLQSEEEVDASFVNGLATNVVVLYGSKARDVIAKFAKEGLQEMGKYQVTKDKLPQEIQTILLT